MLYGLINPGVKPLSRRVPYKFVIGKSFSHLIFNSFEEMEKTLSGYRGQSVSFHAEDMAILENSKNAPTHETRRPPKSEDKGVATAIDLIRKNGLEGKICHVSTREAMMQIREAKKDGVAISGEVTPHHLYFDESAFTDENHIWFQVNPPIRTREDRMAMIEALRNGDIDYLATDHAPHSIEEKQRGISGIPNLDTYGAFTTWLMAKCDFTPMDIARVCAYNPGLFVNQFLPARFGKGFGRIEAGYAGSLTIIDPNAPRTVRREDLKTKCGWSPFEGVEFPGRVMYTIIQGKITKISN